MDIDSAVTSLGDALADAGFERPRPPRDVDWLDELNATIAPLQLPQELERFWRLVDPATLQAKVFPRFTAPAFALETTRIGTAARSSTDDSTLTRSSGVTTASRTGSIASWS